MAQWGQWSGVTSEIGTLECVLVHEPGYEHRQIVPWNKDALLFDDILDVEEARAEHRRFTNLLGARGVRLLYIETLLGDVCAHEQARDAVYREVLGEELAARLEGRLRPYHLIRGYPDHYTIDAGADLAPLPNLYFMRDPAFVIAGTIVIAHPARLARERESRLVAAVLRRHPLFESTHIYDGILRDPEATIEGGDIHVVDERTVLVGIGERTNQAGADHLARFLFEHTRVDRVLQIHIPARREFMHLDTVLAFVDRRRILTLPYLWDDPGIYAAIARRARQESLAQGRSEAAVEASIPSPEALMQASRLEVVTAAGRGPSYRDTLKGLAEEGVIDPALTRYLAGRPDHYPSPAAHAVAALREQWNDAANMLALHPGRLLAYTRNDRTARALEEDDVEVMTFPGGELVRGRGGPRCMVMPLRRAPL